MRLQFRRWARNSLRPPTPAVSPHRALLNQYCVTCHNQRQKAAGATPIALDTLDLANVGRRRRDLGESRPEAARRPDAAGRHAASGQGRSRRVRGAGSKASSIAPRRRHPNPGRTEPFHRLNRAEYRNAVRDLLDLDLDVASLLPADDVELRVRQHRRRAEDVADADGSLPGGGAADQPPRGRHAGAVPNIDYFRIADDLRQDDHLPGMPFGTRGGTRIRYAFPGMATTTSASGWRAT